MRGYGHIRPCVRYRRQAQAYLPGHLFLGGRHEGVGVLYTKTGEYSAVLKIENPVQKYSANIDSYYDFTHLFSALALTLGEGYAIHKQDIFVRKRFVNEDTGKQSSFLNRISGISREGRTRTACVT